MYVHHLGLYCILFRRFLVSKFNVALQLTKKVKVKVKFSHTRYRALGPELMPVYWQSARR